jgi:hypothetical protein
MKTAENSRTSRIAAPLAALLAGALSWSSAATAQGAPAPLPRYNYVDLVELSQSANLVVKAEIRKQATVEPERSPGLRPGWVRLYLEADTQALFAGRTAIGESLRLLADFPLDEKGKPPKLKKLSLVYFGKEVPGRPGELQLLTPDSYMPADPVDEERLRTVLRQVAASDKPPQVMGIKEALSVAGNLAGESETQLFLETREGQPVSITIMRRPGMAPQWGVAWSELVDQAARPPAPETLAWFSLACSLPPALPPSANLAQDEASRMRAVQDYRVVVEQLGPCQRNRR